MTSDLKRREALKFLALSGSAAIACSTNKKDAGPATKTSSARPAVLDEQPIPGRGPWPTPDPFLFCAHHDDHYPSGNEQLGPSSTLEGRSLGNDFEGKDGWNMYHGRTVPGFPVHPHRGFETITIVRRGLLDHADSLGAAARYGEGDVQWLTAGSGIQHAEMFPLLDRDQDNPVELFQIWLNLPRDGKMVTPHFTMLWAGSIPERSFSDEAGRKTLVRVHAGSLEGMTPPPPPPASWAARPGSEVALWTIRLEPHARWTLPAAQAGLSRSLYFFRGDELHAEGRTIGARRILTLASDAELSLEAGARECELLLLQGRPLGEPVARHGPFVMNTPDEIRAAYRDYQATRFGGWPWADSAPVHGEGRERFARRPDGSVERPT